MITAYGDLSSDGRFILSESVVSLLTFKLQGDDSLFCFAVCVALVRTSVCAMIITCVNLISL